MASVRKVPCVCRSAGRLTESPVADNITIKTICYMSYEISWGLVPLDYGD
jgi:hypothetical protein